MREDLAVGNPLIFFEPAGSKAFRRQLFVGRYSECERLRI